MSDELVTTIAAGDRLSVRSESERTIEMRMIPWGVVAQTAEGPERFARGALRGVQARSVVLEAIGPHGVEPGVRLVGRADSIEERDDGAYGVFRVSRVPAGDDLLELVRDGVYSSVSVVFEPLQSRRIDGVTERQRVNLRRVGIVERGAYPAAEVVAVRSEQEPEMPARNEPTPTPVPDPTPTPVPDPEPEPVPPGTRVQVLARSADIDALRTEMVGRMVTLEARGAGPGGIHPLARFATLSDYLDAAWSDPDAGQLLGRALVDQITTPNVGVIPPSWLTDIVGILGRTRPAISAIGGPKSLGSTGMEIDWPYVDPALAIDTVVAEQTVQKTEIASVLVSILKGSAPIKTYAGGSDVSYQLIRRSSPSYREAYVRILESAYARKTEAIFEGAVLGGAGNTIVIAAGVTADQLRAAYFAASATVEDATGAPANVVLASPTAFGAIGGLPGLYPGAYGTSNVSGTAQASTLQINVSGLPVIRAPFLAGNVQIITNDLAAAWHEDGPFPISAEDVAKLGQNIAIWGMGATVIRVPKGIVKSTLT